MKKSLLLPFFLLLFFGTNAQTYYSVTFPNDTTLIGCGTTADVVYPEIIKYGNCSFFVGVSVSDKVITLNTGGQCTKIARRFRLIYWCDYDPNTTPLTTIPNPLNTDQGPTVLGTAQNHGHLEYTQIIKVLDDVAPRFADCPTGVKQVCDYSANDPTQFNNGHTDDCEGAVVLDTKITDDCSGADIELRYLLFLDMDQNGTMETLLSSSDFNAYPIIRQDLGDTLYARIDFSPDFELPYGKHKIEWIARDNCGNQRLCLYEFEVEDCLNPTVVCKNGISVNIMQTGMITVDEDALLEYTADNCTPTMLLKTGIQKAGAGGNFPTGQHQVTFDCNELGPQQVEVWSQDAYGNADFCLATVTVQDNMGSCTQTTNRNGRICSDAGLPLKNAQVTLRQNPPLGQAEFSTTTDDNGYFSLQNVPACGMFLEVETDVFKQQMSVWDALLIAQHLSGRSKIEEANRLLAADVDGDKQLTDFDVNALIMSILKQEKASFRLLPADFILTSDLQNPMPNPSDLSDCAGAIEDSLMLLATQYGDVDGDWAAQSSKREKKHGTMEFFFENRTFQAGETVAIEFFAPDLDGLPAFQLALQYDAAMLQFATQQGGLVPTHWMHHDAAKAQFCAAWQEASLALPSGNKGERPMAFRLVFTALTDGNLADALWLSENAPETVAYGRRGEPYQIELQTTPLLQRKLESNGVSIFPNPCTSFTTLSFEKTANWSSVSISKSDGSDLRFFDSKNWAEKQRFLRIEALKSGVYLVRVVYENGRVDTLSLVVE